MRIRKSFLSIILAKMNIIDPDLRKLAETAKIFLRDILSTYAPTIKLIKRGKDKVPSARPDRNGE
jgi:hypothetical protein